MDRPIGYNTDFFDRYDLSTLFESTHLHELSPDIYRVGNSDIVERKLDTKYWSIDDLKFLNEVSKNFYLITEIHLAPWTLYKDKNKLHLLVKYIEGIPGNKLFEHPDLFKSNPRFLDKVEDVWLSLFLYFIYSYDSKMPFLSDLKIAQLIFNPLTLEPTLVDIEPFIRMAHPSDSALELYKPIESRLISLLGLFNVFKEELSEEILMQNNDFGKKIFVLLKQKFPYVNWENLDEEKFKWRTVRTNRHEKHPEVSFYDNSRRE